MHRLRCNVFVVGLLLFGASPCAAGQEYRFGVPKLEMLVTVNADASVGIAYDITFNNARDGQAIDVVDIGTPHAGYDLANVRASIDSRPCRHVRKSTDVDPGFEIHLDGGKLRPGQQGTLHVEFTMPDMVYQDTTNDALASLRITPTWFGDPYVRGNTHIQVAVQLPKGVAPEEVLHQGPEAGPNFGLKAVTDDGARVGWDWPADRLTKPHMVALSFPKRGLDRVVKFTKWQMLLRWFSQSTDARVWAGAALFAMFALVFFRFTGGTGFSVFGVLSVLLLILIVNRPLAHLIALPVIVVLIGLNEWFLARRKIPYMPPIAQVEGGGIKRGLTAPEAAGLLELPVAKVLSLVIFGMLKKGILRQTQADPLAVEVDEAFRIRPGQLMTDGKERAKFFRSAGQRKGIVVHQYEHPFIYLLESNSGKPVKGIDFGVPIRGLLRRAAARMTGFDLSDTQDYYRAIIRRACQQAAAIGDIPQREKAIDRDFEWILMDDHYPTVFTYGRPYRPIWTRGPIGPSPSGPSAAPSVPGQTSFGDVAASFSGWAENTMGSMASSVMPGSLTAETTSGGVINLSGADRVTGEFFQALGEAASSAGSGGGGGGGGCACAGCACACACAGGGR